MKYSKLKFQKILTKSGGQVDEKMENKGNTSNNNNNEGRLSGLESVDVKYSELVFRVRSLNAFPKVSTSST